jgi:hypothetical protein
MMGSGGGRSLSLSSVLPPSEVRFSSSSSSSLLLHYNIYCELATLRRCWCFRALPLLTLAVQAQEQVQVPVQVDEDRPHERHCPGGGSAMRAPAEEAQVSRLRKFNVRAYTA